jgi:urease accessory protein
MERRNQSKMITVNQSLGNINKNSNLRKKYEEMLKNNLCEKVVITRMETEKLRMRKSTDKKTDVAFMFERNPNLRNDDVIFMDDKKMILLTLESEAVAIITFKSYYEDKENIFPLSVKIGHSLGNLHRPIKVTKNQVIFPIQAETELEMLKKMFSSFSKFLDIQSDNMIFEPDEGSNIHEH